MAAEEEVRYLRSKQPDYPENSSLEYAKHLTTLKPVATGTTLSDTVLAKILHYGYVVYRKGI